MTFNQKSKDKLLFTPGPLTTSRSVKESTLTDLGSRDSVFISYIIEIRKKLLRLAHVDSPEYEAAIMQGSGTFGIESVISSAVPANGMLLNIINGAYGRRISQIAAIHSIPLIELIYEENELPDPAEIENVLNNNLSITHIAVIHGETTTGLINPIKEIGKIAMKYNKSFIVDAMSTFGAYDIDLKEQNIKFLISSSNKCIEGIPGFSFILAEREELEKCKHQSHTLSLDLYEQWIGLNSTGQFRFTPPVHSLIAFHQALNELDKEGGVPARAARYSENNSLLVHELKKIGLKLYLPEEVRGYIITSFMYPSSPNFSFQTFYHELNDRGFVIYPGKLSKTDCFRIGNIGQIYPDDIKKLTEAVKEVLHNMNVELNLN
jgi:2-aminoethylphosphonate-pyruvate transaminase